MNQPFKKDVCTQTRMCYKSQSRSARVAKHDERKKKNLIKKLTVWGEDRSLNVACSGRCVAAGCVRVCDDESESEIKVVYSQTSNPSTKALAWESEGGEGLKKERERENVHPQSIKPH